MTNELIIAKLVYDGGSEVRIPSELGIPRNDQMIGTPAEQLTELAGRACYDSLGKGRPSFTEGEKQGYHDHIIQVGHGSVWEHFNFTAEIPFGDSVVDTNRKLLVAFHCANRPGVLCIPVHSPIGLRVTLNARSVVEWSNWTASLYGRADDQFLLDRQIAFTLAKLGKDLAPHIIQIPGPPDTFFWTELENASLSSPISDNEQWVSMFLAGSRGLSHELVRHGDFTAISQRSTRYVDESESQWVRHPLINAFISDRQSTADEHADDISYRCNDVIDRIESGEQRVIAESRTYYGWLVDRLQEWLIAHGVDKLTARKQARGAARGYLGNALSTELIFSANVAQWKRMLRQRATVHADAEIRELFCKVLGELKQSRYADRFDQWELDASPDGIGQIAKEAA